MNVTLRQRNKNKKISLYLDYYHKGKRKYEYLGLYLNPNPKTSEDRNINKKTLELAENIRAKRLLETQNGVFNFNYLDKQNGSFIEYFKNLTEKRKNSKGNYGNWLSTLNHLKNFSKSDIKFSEIDKKWVEDFKDYLIDEAKTKQNKNLSTNSCVSYFNKVKAALKQAVNDDIISKNPSININIKPEETEREFLTLEELKKLVITDCDSQLIKNAFIFTCLSGLRFSDIEKLTWSEIQHSNENGYYIRFKQKKTKGQETLPISAEAIKLIGKRGNDNEKVFQGLSYSDLNNKKIQKWINSAGINKHITFHCGRHSYATLQLTLKTDIYTVSKLLGHKHLKTTEIYAKIINEKKIKAANRIKLEL